jgi:hypothetical protein
MQLNLEFFDQPDVRPSAPVGWEQIDEAARMSPQVVRPPIAGASQRPDIPSSSPALQRAKATAC